MGQGFISKYILRDIAGFIRKRKGTTDEIKPVDMAAELESIPTFEDGIEQGKQAEYDRFWDAFQQGGNRTSYANAFQYEWWNDISFKPKYDLICKGSTSSMFDRFGGAQHLMPSTVSYNLIELLKNSGVILSTGGATTMNNMFYYSCISHIPVIDATGVSTTIIGCFAGNTRLKVIEKFILKSDGSQNFSSVFHNCHLLTDLIIEGVIGQNGLDLQWSTKLSKASIESIVGCLSTTTSGLSVTLSKTAVNNAFTTEEWTALEQTRPNWTISLV